MTDKILIFRVPDDTEVHAFAEIAIDADGTIQDTGRVFYINDAADTYTKLSFDQLVFADRVEGGSTNARSITVRNKDDTPVVVHQFSYEELQAAVDIILPQLNPTVN